MALRPVQVNIKALDDSAVGRFWAEALGWGVSSEGPGMTNVEPGGGFVSPGPRRRLHRRRRPTRNPGQRRRTVCTSISPPLPRPIRRSWSRASGLSVRRPPTWARATCRRGALRPEGNEFCVLEPREIYRDTRPIAAVVVDCADPRAMARFSVTATDWTLHEVTDDRAVLRSAKGVGPYLEFLRKPGVKTVPDRVHLDLLPYPGDDKAAEVARLRGLGATDLDLGQGDVRGRAWPTRRDTSSASSAGPDAQPRRHGRRGQFRDRRAPTADARGVGVGAGGPGQGREVQVRGGRCGAGRRAPCSARRAAPRASP